MWKTITELGGRGDTLFRDGSGAGDHQIFALSPFMIVPVLPQAHRSMQSVGFCLLQFENRHFMWITSINA